MRCEICHALFVTMLMILLREAAIMPAPRNPARRIRRRRESK